MRALVIAGPAVTHLMLMAPLAWALRAAGDDILVAGPPDIAGAAAAAGLSTFVLGDDHREVERWRRRPPPDPSGEPPWAFFREEWRDRAGRLGPRCRELIRDWRPDLLITDPLEFLALSAGAALGIPVVQHRWGLDRIGGARMHHMREALGELATPALVLDPCPPAVRVPDVPEGAPISAIPSNGIGSQPAWARRRERSRRLCLSVGNRTLRMGGMPMLRAAVDAAAALPDTETVVTIDQPSRAALGPVPDSIRLVDPVPLDLFLGTCDAVVQHGGWGTAFTALAFGLPQIVLPLFPYSAEVADRMAAAGVGPAVDPAEGTPAIAEAVRAVLDVDRYRAAAGTVRREMELMPSPAEVTETLRSLL